MKPISLYIHIPFCKAKCYYCDFASNAGGEDYYDPYISALLGEIERYRELQHDYIVKSIFIGGGTPTVLPLNHIEKLMDQLYRIFPIEQNAEITIESNPGTMNKKILKDLLKNHINRLSMGLQAWQNVFLKRLGRIHSQQQFLANYYEARDAGFENINIDLMFALPDQSIREWEETLENVVKLGPEHISTYSLIVEEGTPFFAWKQQNKLNLPDEELDRKMYHTVIQRLKDRGYDHYEISNFAKPTKECYHNTVYWEGKDYIGLGLGAHSYFNDHRFHNTYILQDYIDAKGDLSLIKQDIQYIEKKAAMEEFMFLGLRMMKGISFEEFENKFNQPLQEVYGYQLKKLIRLKLLKIEENHVKLTLDGIDVSNTVFEEFLIE